MPNLTPVDFNPFEKEEKQPKLTAVDFDPFAENQEQESPSPSATRQQRNQQRAEDRESRQSSTDFFEGLPEDVIAKIKEKTTSTRTHDSRGRKLDKPEEMFNIGEAKRLAGLEHVRLKNPYLAEDIENMSSAERALVGMGMGFHTVGRGIGLVDNEPREADAALTDYSPAATAGKFAGQTAPFIPLGMGAGGLAVKAGGKVIGPATTAQRIAAGATVGGSEGGILARGEGGDAKDVLMGTVLGAGLGGLGEMVIPYLNRVGRNRINELTGKETDAFTPEGKPTQELLDTLEEAGVSFGEFIEAAKNSSIDDVTKDAAGKAGLDWGTLNESLQAQMKKQVKEALEIGSDLKPEALIRKAVYESQGLTPTRALITRDFEDALTEQNLLTTPEGQAIRDIYNRNNQKVRENIQALAPEGSQAVDAPSFGKQFRAPIDEKDSLNREALNTIYDAAVLAEGGRKTSAKPLVRNLQENLTTLRTTNAGKPVIQYLKDMKILPKDVDVLDKEMLGQAINLEKMTLRELSGLRRIVNQSWKSATRQGDGVAETQLNQMREILNNMEENAGGTLFKIYRQARAQKGKDFENNPLIDKLLKDKKGYYGTDMIEDSEVFNKVVLNSTPEQFAKVYRLVDDKGKNLTKAQVAKYIEDRVFSNQGTNDIGEIVGSSAKLQQAIRSIGENKLRIIFGKETDEILNFAKTVREITNPPRGTVPQGSAPKLEFIKRNLLRAFTRMSALPSIVGDLAESFANSLQKGAAEKEARGQAANAINIMDQAKTKMDAAKKSRRRRLLEEENARFMRSSAAQAAGALPIVGVAAASQEDE